MKKWALALMPRFADAVKSGRKRTTIRRAGKRDIKAGDIIRFYINLRRPDCEFVCEREVAKVENARLSGGEIQTESGDTDNLARGDGFEDAAEMNRFLMCLYPDGTRLKIYHFVL